MHVIAQRRVGVDGVDDLADEIARMRGRETYAAYSGSAPHVSKQCREIPTGGRRIAVTVHVLAEKLDLGISSRGQLACFGHDGGAGAAALRPACERHDAIGAGFIASFDDGDVGAMRVVAARERRIEGLIGIEAQAGDAAIARFELYQHFGKAIVTGGSAYQADVRRLLE